MIAIYKNDLINVLRKFKDELDDGAYVPAEEGKGLSTNDYTNADKQKLASLPAANQIVTVETGKGLSTNDYTDADKAKVATIPASFDLSNYVEKETGKGLSSNDFNNTYKNKLDELPAANAIVLKETGKGLTSNDYTTAEKSKLASLPAASDIVTKVSGKDLSTNDYSTAEKTKLAAVPTPSTIAVLDANGKVPIANLPAEFNALETVATYADLPISGNYDGRKVMVLNASGDPTVVSGFAIYVYSATNTQWGKVAEGESMDLVLDWTNIQNKPSVENVLTSTSTTNMLSAAQGKALKDLIDAAPTASNVITGVAEGSTNGTVAVTKNGTATDISVHGLGSAAYTASSDYSASNHTHGNISTDGKIGSTANLPLITTTNGAVTVGSFGNTANSFCEGNDSRLSDARTPTAHTHTQVNGYTISVVSALPASPDSNTIYFVLES